MARIRESVTRKVWYQAGGRCAFPHKLELSLPHTGELFGRIAHIVARSSAGPRGDPIYSEEQLHDCDNLILLCPNHHAEVDTNVSTWTVHKLREIKKSHEEWVRQRLKWVEPSGGGQTFTKILVVLWGASSAGKDVVLNRILLRLDEHCPAVDLQRFTTRAQRPEEAEDSPFQYLDKDGFFQKVSRGDISCVHTANNSFYGFDSHFAEQAPANTVVMTCMRQFRYLDELTLRATARGLAVYNILLKADYNTLHARTLLRGTRQKEKTTRMKPLKQDADWFSSNENTGVFDLVVDNSDYSCLNAAVESVYNFIITKRRDAET